MVDKNAVEVRRYTRDDFDAIIEMCMQEIPKLTNYETIKLEPSRIRFLMENSINDDSAFCLYVLVNLKGELVGAIAGYCVTQLISWDKATGDIFLFVHPTYRTIDNAVTLISAYVNWAKRRKAVLIQATLTSGYRSDAMSALLKKRCGFEIIGTLYRIKGNEQ